MFNGYLLLLAACLLLPLRTICAAEETTRIVSLVPACTNILYATGASDQIIGVSDYCRVPPGSNPPRLGALLNPDLERMVLMRPHIVFLFHTQKDIAGKLKALRVKPQLFSVDSLEEFREAAFQIAATTGLHAQTTDLFARINSQLDAISSRSATLRRVKTLIIVSRRPGSLADLYQNTPQMFLSRLAARAGGTPALHSGAHISSEDIIRANPELIIDMSLAETHPHTTNPAPALAAWDSLHTVSAVKNGLVLSIADPQALVIGDHITSTALIMESLVDRARQKLP